MESKICPVCSGAGIHNDGNTYMSCWECFGMGYIDVMTADEILVEAGDMTSLTEPANLLYVEDYDDGD